MRYSALWFASLFMFAMPALAQDAPAPAAATPPVAEAPKAVPFVYKPDEQDIMVGVPEAPVTIVEYASLSCPHCAHFYQEIMPQLKTRYIDPGKVKLVYRNYPLNPSALEGAKLIACAEGGQKKNFLKVLFGMQDKWAFEINSKDALANIAAVGGVTREKFEACQNNPDLEKKILAPSLEARNNQWVQSTPTFFIGSTKIEGAEPIESFAKVIDPMLKK